MNENMGGKHIPQRTCVGCLRVRLKRVMVRVVRTPQGEVEVDPTGKKSGRGAYLCRQRSCWETALAKGRLAHALKVAITDEARADLESFAPSLPETEPQEALAGGG